MADQDLDLALALHRELNGLTRGRRGRAAAAPLESKPRPVARVRKEDEGAREAGSVGRSGAISHRVDPLQDAHGEDSGASMSGSKRGSEEHQAPPAKRHRLKAKSEAKREAATDERLSRGAQVEEVDTKPQAQAQTTAVGGQLQGAGQSANHSSYIHVAHLKQERDKGGGTGAASKPTPLPTQAAPPPAPPLPSQEAGAAGYGSGGSYPAAAVPNHRVTASGTAAAATAAASAAAAADPACRGGLEAAAAVSSATVRDKTKLSSSSNGLAHVPPAVKCFYAGVRWGFYLPPDALNSRADLATALNDAFADEILSCGRGDMLAVLFLDGDGSSMEFPSVRGTGIRESGSKWKSAAEKARKVFVNRS